ncbi:unnamed protein product, partial [marine sediment metagenome]
NDMLTRSLEEGLRPDLDVLVFDEAQDSSPLQYKVLDFWLQGVKRHYIGGDPDQCIYQWMGTDPGILMGRSCDRQTHLVQSYRVPRADLLPIHLHKFPGFTRVRLIPSIKQGVVPLA